MFIAAIYRADADCGFMPIHIRALHGDSQAFGDREQLFLAVPISHCHEFLTAIAIEMQPKILHKICHHLAKMLQTSVPGGVTVAVIEVLEMIDIQH